jgi:RNA polymerase sigma-70 factor (ECF subfamily)
MLSDRAVEEAPPLPEAASEDGASATLDPLAEEIRGLAPRQAVEICARRHGRTVGRLCMALLGSRAEADEAMQETFLAAALAIGSYRGEGTVRAWLLSIARRTCARRLETRTRRAGRLELVHDAGAGQPLPDEAVDAEQRGRRVRQALGELRPSEREVLLLRYEAGLGFREVAQACGIDEATARKRASRALDRLRKLLPIEDV